MTMRMRQEKAEMTREYLGKSIKTNLERLILPVLKKLKRRGSRRDRHYLELLEKNFLDITSSFGVKVADPRWKLTAREIEVCNMIRSGLATKDIADVLCISRRTVEHHRNHIRRKLGLAGNSAGLAGYLRSLS